MGKDDGTGADDAVRLERDGAVAWLILNRPGQINAINDAIRHSVPAALAHLQADPAIRVIVIRGEGARGFCAGADIKEQHGPESPLAVRRRKQSVRWIDAVEHIEKPVIAAIHGYCMGGGLELALACDIRYAAPDAVFALPETSLGLIPGGGGTQRLPRVIGLGRALDLLLSGDRLDAVAAEKIGLVTRVASSSESLLTEVGELARRIAGKSPDAIAFVKRAAKAAMELDLKRGLDLELDLFAMLAPAEDAQEAALAFREKRMPQFSVR